MWLSVSILCVLVAFANARSIPYYPPLSSDLVNHINKLNTTWKVSTGLGFVLFWDFFFFDALLNNLFVGLNSWALGVSPWWLHQTSLGPS